MRGYGAISSRKVSRKISYLRSMRQANPQGPQATAHTWRTFWKIFFALKLATEGKYGWRYY